MMNKADKMALIEVNERLAMNKLIKVESVLVYVLVAMKCAKSLRSSSTHVVYMNTENQHRSRLLSGGDADARGTVEQ